eukprot:g2260.t1
MPEKTPDVIHACCLRCTRGLTVIRRTLASIKTPGVDPDTSPQGQQEMSGGASTPAAPAAASPAAPPSPPKSNGSESASSTTVAESYGSSSDYRQVLDLLLKCGGHLDMIATKFTVTVEACASQGDNDSAWASSLCKSVDSSCENFVSSCLVASACGCGAFLRKEVLKSGEGVVAALESQLKCAVKRLEIGTSDNAKVKKQLVVLTGQVTSACSELKRIPKSNRGYLKRVVMNAYKQSLDICTEQKEMVKDSEESPRVDVVEDAGDTSGRSDVVSDSFEEDLWDYDFSLSASEIASSTKCISLMESAIAFLKVVAKAVGVSSKTDAGSPGAEAAVDTGCVAVTQFGIALNELGVSLCPPQDTPNILMSVDGVLSSANTLSGALGDILVSAGLEPSSENSSTEGAAAQKGPTGLQNAFANVEAGLAELNLIASDIKMMN